MMGEALDGLDYETYLELRPAAECRFKAGHAHPHPRRARDLGRRRPGHWPGILALLVLVAAGVAYRDAHAARITLIALLAGALAAWARAAWSVPPRATPFGPVLGRLVDRTAVALGSISALGLWATYAPRLPLGLARAVGLGACALTFVYSLLVEIRRARTRRLDGDGRRQPT